VAGYYHAYVSWLKEWEDGEGKENWRGVSGRKIEGDCLVRRCQFLRWRMTLMIYGRLSRMDCHPRRCPWCR
jgi:hypothetical protein